jgi:hypothetical protein
MRLKAKHLRHPVHAVRIAKNLATKYLNAAMLGYQGSRKFKDDPRYSLQGVIKGFAQRVSCEDDDGAFLERVCTAYSKAVEQQKKAAAVYGATEWWQLVRQASLGPVMEALAERDIQNLRTMYRNFFRHPCSAGLIGLPLGLPWTCFHGLLSKIPLRGYLADALFRVAYWKEKTEGTFSLVDLAGPDAGNPFGVMLDGVLLRPGAEYQHYCAWRIHPFANFRHTIIAEIGGGYGGMAYYLLRDRENITYIDFDVPESLALTAYYLSRAFPQKKLLLYGEQNLTFEAIAQADIVLLPLYEMENMPLSSVDITFSSHAISDVSQAAMDRYMNAVSRITRDAFLCVMDKRAGAAVPRLDGFGLVDEHATRWSNPANPVETEVEYLFRREERSDQRSHALKSL